MWIGMNLYFERDILFIVLNRFRMAAGNWKNVKK
jgi:hypothetical protein